MAAPRGPWRLDAFVGAWRRANRTGVPAIRTHLLPLAEADTAATTLADLDEAEEFYALAARFDRVRFMAAWTLDHLRRDLAARLGRIDEAERWYRSGIDWAAEHGITSELVRCRLGLARIGRGDGPRSQDLTDKVPVYWREVACGRRRDPYVVSEAGPPTM